MISEYDIYFGNEKVGTASVERQGLYYHFICRCRLPGPGIFRVVVEGDGYHENLGVLVPWGSQFGLSKRVPVKRLGTGKLNFRVRKSQSSAEGHYVAVYPDEPFAYLSKLKNAYLEIRNGQAGVIIKDPE